MLAVQEMLFTDGLESKTTAKVSNSRVCSEPGDCVGKFERSPLRSSSPSRGGPLLNPQEVQSLEVFRDPISDVLVLDLHVILVTPKELNMH